MNIWVEDLSVWRNQFLILSYHSSFMHLLLSFFVTLFIFVDVLGHSKSPVRSCLVISIYDDTRRSLGHSKWSKVLDDGNVPFYYLVDALPCSIPQRFTQKVLCFVMYTILTMRLELVEDNVETFHLNFH